jgi:hypothetical protein
MNFQEQLREHTVLELDPFSGTVVRNGKTIATYYDY